MEVYKGSRVHELLGIQRSTFLVYFFVIFYVLFLVTGAFMFTAMEAPVERTIRMQLQEKQLQFLMDHPCVSKKDLEDLVQEIVRACNKGISAEEDVLEESNWSFAQSFFFSSTVVTTIGYGHVTPLTLDGKIFCILYAAIGIPLHHLLMTVLADRMMRRVSSFRQYVCNRLSHLYSAITVRLIHSVIAALILVILFIVIPAAIFAQLEPDWDFLDSVYYCFISLTTVGLGDYIPGDAKNQKHRSLYKILTTAYLLVGLVFTTLGIAIFKSIPEFDLMSRFNLESNTHSVNSERIRLRESPAFVPNYTQSSNPREVILASAEEEVILTSTTEEEVDETRPLTFIQEP